MIAENMKFVCSILYYMFMRGLNKIMTNYKRKKDTKGNDIYSELLFEYSYCEQWFKPTRLKKGNKEEKALLIEHQ